jgi:hypothetical protein
MKQFWRNVLQIYFTLFKCTIKMIKILMIKMSYYVFLPQLKWLDGWMDEWIDGWMMMDG